MAESSIIFSTPQDLQSVLDTGSTATLISPLTINSAGQPITINNIEITDGFGAKYDADYSATGILDPRWIPDYGAVQTLVSGHDLQAVLDTGAFALTANEIFCFTGANGNDRTGFYTKYGAGNTSAITTYKKVGANSAVSTSSGPTDESILAELVDDNNRKALFRMQVTGTGGGAVPDGVWAMNNVATGTFLSLDIDTFRINTDGGHYQTVAQYIANGAFVDESFVPKLYVDQAYTTGETYTVTNVTTDRTYDADSSSVDELADVVGTLITDLKTVGIIL